jgi:disulfide bond formation protein DsbB
MKFIKENLMQFTLVIATVSTLGSLYFSEIVKFPPCSLCWYQRLFMYPIMIVIIIGLWKKDKNLVYYILPFSIIGLIIAIYHNLLYYGFISENLQPCTVGVSCTESQLDLFGFVTIPLLSLLGFLAINFLTLIYYKIQKNKHS